jgi:uncharacterized protein (TIGR02271 family)
MQSITHPAEATVAGLFNDHASADKAVAELRAAGFADSTIEEFHSERSQNNAEDSGGFMGAFARFFGAEPNYDTPSLQETSSVHDRLIAFGLDDGDAHEFQAHLEQGSSLVMLRAGKRGIDAIDILKRNGATPAQIEASAAESLPASADRLPASTPVAPMTSPASTAIPSEQRTQRLQLLKEVLRVNKERVQYGEVQLHKEVVSEQQTLEVPLNREEIVIERHPVAEDKTATGTIGAGETIRIPLSEERVSVEKRNVVSEEVTIGTREVQETRKIDETVRREELRTDKQGNVVSDDQDKSRTI